MQINNSPMFGGLFNRKSDDDKKAKHPHHAGHTHKGHAAHHNKHHQKPAFGSITASGHSDSFSRTPKP